MSVAREYNSTPRYVQTETGGPRLVPAGPAIAARPAVPFSIVLLALVAVVVAAWGAAAPYAGPDFGFVADRFGAWQWSTTSACLALGPGVVALFASLWVLGASLRTAWGRRPDLWVLGLIVAGCGAWFVVGQFVWPVIYGNGFIAPSGATHFMWKELCFAVGPGVILVFCGAIFMGWAVRRQLAVVAERGPNLAPAAAAPVVATPVVATTEPGVMASPTAPPTGTMVPPPVTSERPVVERRPATSEEPTTIVERVVEHPAAPTDLPPPAPPA